MLPDRSWAYRRHFPSHCVSAKARSARSAREESAAVVPSPASSRRMLAASSRRDHFTPRTSRWRSSTDSATTSIASGTSPVPLPHQREAGFQQAAGRVGGQSPTADERARSAAGRAISKAGPGGGARAAAADDLVPTTPTGAVRERSVAGRRQRFASGAGRTPKAVAP